MTAYVLVQTATQNGRIASLIRRSPGSCSPRTSAGRTTRSRSCARTRRGAFQPILEQIRDLPGVIHALAAPLVREPFGLADSHAA